MKKIEMYEMIKNSHSEFVIFVKFGSFYRVFNDDIYIIWYFTRYRIVDGKRIGFPVSIIDDLVELLTHKHISYIIYNNDFDYIKVSSINNCYNKYVLIGKELYRKEERINKVLSLIETKIRKENMLEYYEEWCK